MRSDATGGKLRWVRLVWSEGSGTECVLALGCAGVEPLVFAGQVVAPVVVVVAVGDDGAQGEDRFGALESPPGSGDVESVADQVAACSFDDGPILPRQPALLVIR